MDSVFLLRRVAPDRGNLLDYESHIRRLKKISNANVKKKVAKETETTLRYFRFKKNGIKPSLAEEKRVFHENSILRDKMINITKKPSSYFLDKPTSIASQVYHGVRTLNGIGMNKESERVAWENLLMMKRLVKTPPVISRREQEKGYEDFTRYSLIRSKHGQRDGVTNISSQKLLTTSSSMEWKKLFAKEQINMSLEILLIKFFKPLYEPDLRDEEEIYHIEIKSNDSLIYSSEKGTFDKLLKLKINTSFLITKEKNTRTLVLSVFKTKNQKTIFCGSGELKLDNIFAVKEFQTVVIDFFAANVTRYAHLAKPIEWEKSGCMKLSIFLEVEKKEVEQPSRLINSQLSKRRETTKDLNRTSASNENVEEQAESKTAQGESKTEYD